MNPRWVAVLCLGCLLAGMVASAALFIWLSEDRSQRQKIVVGWGHMCFGMTAMSSVLQRGIRFFEEACEATQAAGVTREMAHKQVDYVWDRPVGELEQEIGGCEIGILCLADAAGLDADLCGQMEVSRVLSKPPKYFQVRNQAKNDAGFDLTEEG